MTLAVTRGVVHEGECVVGRRVVVDLVAQVTLASLAEVEGRVQALVGGGGGRLKCFDGRRGEAGAGVLGPREGSAVEFWKKKKRTKLSEMSFHEGNSKPTNSPF